MDRPSRLLIFARRQRRLVKPALAGIVLMAAGGFALHVDHAMRSEQSFAPMRAELGRVSGLPVVEIIVQGRNMQPEASVLEALGGHPRRTRCSASRSSRPVGASTGSPSSSTRPSSAACPAPCWYSSPSVAPSRSGRTRGRFVLIDRNGQVVAQQGMNGKDAEAFAQLPLVVGAGAPAAAAALVDALDTQPTVRSQVVAAVRVGQRRWNLTLRSGADVLLPEGEEVPALARLAQLEDHMQLLERPLVNIDLRLPDRLQLRMRPQPAPDAADSGRPPPRS